MPICTICRTETAPDDVVVASAAAPCICLSCYTAMTGSVRPMRKSIERDIIDVLCSLALT